MNISIRILGLSETIVSKLEEHSLSIISDLIHSDLHSLGLTAEEEEQLQQAFRNYKCKEFKKELTGQINRSSYQHLNYRYPLERMNLSLRSYNALSNSNIRNLSALLATIEDIKIYSVENLGTKSITQLMKSVNEIVRKENLDQEIPIFYKHHPSDDLPVDKLGFSQGAILSLTNLQFNTLGVLRRYYLSGELLELFSYKTLKVILEEFEKYYTDFPNPDFAFFKTFLIEECLGKIKLEDLKNYTCKLGIDFNSENFIMRIAKLSDLVIEGDIIRLNYFEETLRATKLKKESKAILRARFNGATLQTVADSFHKTRERIRQIVRDRMSQIRMFYEEAFIKEYNKFVWHPQVFKKVYGLNDFSFNVVKYLGYKFSFEEEAVFPEAYIKELMASGKIEKVDLEALKDSFPEIFSQRMDIYGVTVNKMTKRLFLEYVIEHFVPNAGLHKQNIVELANKVARENNLDYHYDKYIDIVSNTIQGLMNVRYYNYQALSEAILSELKKIMYEVDSVYSCNYFYRKYPELMKKADIRDGYELHFVLRRFF
ncbi:MAG: hypothetical protein GX661_06675, partial [Acholeplasmataceae bacterium]|nr:hypothetical protein [Acholeplasmataceae bacterium]